jgi:hypothetical protein
MMEVVFLLCAECRRHLKARERVCPFCGAEVATGTATVGAANNARIGRDRLTATFGVAVASALLVEAACLQAPTSSGYGAPCLEASCEGDWTEAGPPNPGYVSFGEGGRPAEDASAEADTNPDAAADGNAGTGVDANADVDADD